MLEAHLYGFNPSAPSHSDTPSVRAGASPLRVAAFPTPTNPVVWRGFVETEDFYQVLSFNVLRPFDATRGQTLYKPEDSPVVEAALRTHTASEFAKFARYRLTLVDRREDGYRVVFTDFRFSGERPNAFVCTIVLDEDLRVVREHFSF